MSSSASAALCKRYKVDLGVELGVENWFDAQIEVEASTAAFAKTVARHRMEQFLVGGCDIIMYGCNEIEETV